MLIPLGTDRPLARSRTIVPLLIFVNAAVFLGLAALRPSAPELAARAESALVLRPGAGGAWTFLTYAFLHAGWMHLLGNMLFLWIFGPNVEDKLGRAGFLGFYLGGAAAAGATHALFEGSPVVGASGAVASVTGAYLVLFPFTNVRVLWVLGLIGVYTLPAWWFIGGAVAWDLLLQGLAPGDRIARLAHLGGYAYGAGLCLALRVLGWLSPENYDLFSALRQAKRRREFAAAAALAERRSATPALSTPEQEALAAMRAEIQGLIREGRLGEAGDRYRVLLERFPQAPPAALALPRRLQRDLGNGLLSTGRPADAVGVYERFAAAFPDDPEIGSVRVLTALLCTRDLNDPARAERALAGVNVERLPQDEQAVVRSLRRRGA